MCGIKNDLDIFALSILVLCCLDLNKVNMLGLCFSYYLWLSLWQILPSPVCAACHRSAKFVMSTLYSSLLMLLSTESWRLHTWGESSGKASCLHFKKCAITAIPLLLSHVTRTGNTLGGTRKLMLWVLWSCKIKLAALTKAWLWSLSPHMTDVTRVIT